MAVITISRQRCSFGSEIAAALAQKLGFELINHDTILSTFVETTPHEHHMLTESAKFFLSPSSSGEPFIDIMKRNLREYMQTHSAVLVGFGSQTIFSDDREALHIRVTAPRPVRVSRLKKQYHVSDEQAEQILAQSDRKQQKFVSTVFGIELADPSHYHMTFNTASLSVDECVAAIIALREQSCLRRQIEQQAAESTAQCNVSDMPLLKNQAEIEFAKLLDMYHIDWIYEPKTFPVEWDAAGSVISAFSPDFYLTKFDTYIELTTMNQKYVTAKNKKVKRLRELYPGTNIKLVYKKDFASLMERFHRSSES